MKIVMKTKIKHFVNKGDKVIIITGDDKGKINEVLEIHKNRNLVKVQDVHMQTHYNKKKDTTMAGIVEKEGWIHISNVSHICKDNKATKVKKIRTDNKVEIFSRRTQEQLRIKTKKKDLSQVLKKKDIHKDKL
jgi:large subunit ribosomal protein L24